MDEWSVLIKVARGPGQAAIARTELDALLDRLPGSDKGSTGGDGPDATISFWIEAVDAASAIHAGWRAVEAGRADLGLEPWRPIRTHAASAAQRLTGFEGIEERIADERAWSVLLKATGSASTQAVDARARSRLSELLGPDATVGGDERTLVARYWVTATDAAAVDVTARAAFIEGLEALGGAEGWTIVRAHHAVASERAEEIYRGAAERARVAAR